MLRAHHAISVLLAVMLTAGLGCAGEDTSDDLVTTAEMESVSAQPSIIGTFRNEGTAVGIASLTLKTNWTYHAEKAVPCERPPCPWKKADGLYRFTRRGSDPILMLMDDAGGNVEEYKYEFRRDVLSIAPNVERASWHALKRSDVAWCGVPKDCGLQNLPVGPCSGVWTCTANACNYQCGMGGSELSADRPASSDNSSTAPQSTMPR